MARKKKHPEHENLERWLVSYADFMTLLFATFVVLYALSQTNINEFKKIEEALRKAFSAQSILDGGSGVMSSGESIMEMDSANSVIDTLLMEYISKKYEQESFEQIKKEIEEKLENGELTNVEAKIDDRGLVITITDSTILFDSASAVINEPAKKILDDISKLIVEKFAMHAIRVEGHTDYLAISGRYPSNWELSSARASSIVRYMIDKFKILPDLMSAVGYADTRPLAQGKDAKSLAKNRRVEIVVLKNINKNLDHYQNSFMKMSREDQQRKRNEQIKIIKEIDNKELESLGEDVINTTDMNSEPKYNSNSASDYLKETDRIERLSQTSK